MHFQHAKHAVLATTLSLAMLVGCTPAPTASSPAPGSASSTSNGANNTPGGLSTGTSLVGGAHSGSTGVGAGGAGTAPIAAHVAPLSTANADVATDDADVQGFDVAAETVGSASAYTVQDTTASADANASTTVSPSPSTVPSAETSTAPSALPSAEPSIAASSAPSPAPSPAPSASVAPAKKVGPDQARKIRERRERELAEKLRHMNGEERQVYRLLHDPNIPWNDNHDGTKTKSISLDFSRNLPGGQTFTRHLSVTRTVDATTYQLVSGETKLSDKYGPGGTKVTDWTKQLQSDGSYKVVFTSDRKFANGPERTAVWNKTFDVDGNVSGTGTITWFKKDGTTVISTETITFGGTEETPKPPMSTKVDGAAPADATTEVAPTPAPDAG